MRLGGDTTDDQILDTMTIEDLDQSGQIRAGLEPGRAALYRLVPSKEALLEAAIEAHLEGLVGAGDDLSGALPGDVREGALALGRWIVTTRGA